MTEIHKASEMSFGSKGEWPGEENGGKPRRGRVKKALMRGGLVLLVCYGICLLCNLYVLHTWRRDTTDYLAEVNKIGWKDVPEEQNAWTFYEKAISLYVEKPKAFEEYIQFVHGDKHARYSELDETQKAMCRDWIEKNQDAWRQVELGSQKDYYWRRIGSLSYDDIDTETYSKLRQLTKLGFWRARLQADEGHIEEAWHDSLAVIKMGRLVIHENIVIGILVGFGILELGENAILEIIRDQDLSREHLERIQGELTGLFSDGFPKMNFQGEIFNVLGNTRNAIEKTGLLGVKGILFPANFLVLGTFDSYKRRVQTFDSQLTGQDAVDDFNIQNDKGITINIPKNMLNSVKPALLRCVMLRNQYRGEYDALATILAVKRWKTEKGSYPDRLGELVASGFLAGEPADPYSDGPMRYEKRGDNFILYSVGTDRQDNGGEENPKSRWGESPDKGGGDRVFWPMK
jgi:hypothetical protein